MKQSLCRKIFFNCGYKDDNENLQGKNFMAKVYLEGQPDPKTSMIINLIDFKEILNPVIDTLDHKYLNTDVSEFKTQSPNTYRIAKYIYKQLSNKLTGPLYDHCDLKKIELYEDKNNWVEVND
jgi:6-pyruvoyl tetrahydropterin synthase/QueD family protein